AERRVPAPFLRIARPRPAQRLDRARAACQPAAEFHRQLRAVAQLRVATAVGPAAHRQAEPTRRDARARSDARRAARARAFRATTGRAPTRVLRAPSRPRAPGHSRAARALLSGTRTPERHAHS